MNCPRGHGPLLLKGEDGERGCLICGFVAYPSVLDLEEAKVETKRVRRRPLKSHGVPL